MDNNSSSPTAGCSRKEMKRPSCTGGLDIDIEIIGPSLDINSAMARTDEFKPKFRLEAKFVVHKQGVTLQMYHRRRVGIVNEPRKRQRF